MGSGIGRRAHAVARTALDRIETLEKGISTMLGNQQGLLEGSGRAFALVDERLATMERLIGALVTIVGPGEVERVVTQQVRDTAEQRANIEKASIAAAVEAGKIKVVETIGEKSLFAGREILQDGEVRHPGWEQMFFGQVKQELQARLLGKRVGDRVDMEAGQFEILEIYEVLAGAQEVAPVVETPPTEEGLNIPPPAEDESIAKEILATPSEEDADAAFEEYMAAVDKPGIGDETLKQ